MIRRLARRVAARLVRTSPRVPSAPPSGRQPASTRSEWAPPPGATVQEDEHPEPDQTDPPPDVEMEAEVVALRLRDDPESIVLLDIREPHELRQGHAQGALVLPMNTIPDRLHLLPRDRTIAVYCAAGVRSFGVAHYLREQGIVDSWSVPGGLGDLASEGVGYTHPARAPGRWPGQSVTVDGEPAVGVLQSLDQHQDGTIIGSVLLDHPSQAPTVVQVAVDKIAPA